MEEINTLEKNMDEARDSISSETEGIIREMEYDDRYSSLFENLSDEARQIAQMSTNFFDFSSREGTDYREDLMKQYARVFETLEENPAILELQTQINEAETVGAVNELRNQLANELERVFGADGEYDNTERAVILGLKFDIADDNSLIDSQNLYNTILGITGTKALPNITEDNLSNLGIEDSTRVLELFREGVVKFYTSWNVLKNLLEADMEPSNLFEWTQKLEQSTSIFDTVEKRVEDFLGNIKEGQTFGYSDETIAKEFDTWPETMREAIQQSAEAIAEGSSDIESEVVKLAEQATRELFNTYDSISTEMNSMIFGEDAEIDGTIDKLSELSSALSATADSYDKITNAEIEYAKYGRISGKTMLDLLSSNVMYASVLDITGEKIALQEDAQQKMLAVQLASIKAQIQEAITEHELTIKKNETTIAELEGVGAAGKMITTTDDVIDSLNQQAKAYATVAQAASAMQAAIQGDFEEAQNILKENWAEDTNIGKVDSVSTSTFYTQEDAKAEIARLEQENTRLETELKGLNSTYEALGGDEGEIDVNKFMWWYDPGQMEEYKDAISGASGDVEELMTQLERLKKYRELIDKEWEAMEAYNEKDMTWRPTEYFNKMREALQAEIAETKAEMDRQFKEAMADGVLTKEEEEQQLDYQADLIELQKDLNNLDDEEVEDAISLLETREASVYALMEAQKELIATSDTEEELIERQAELIDLIREERDLRKEIREYTRENMERATNYISGSAYSNATRYNTYNNIRMESLKADAKQAMETYQEEFSKAYNQYLSEGMSGPEAYQRAQMSEYVRDAVTEYFDALEAQGDLIVERFEDKISELERNLDELEQTKPEEWSNIGQIKPYYNAVISNITQQIKQIEEALQNTEMMTDEQIEEWIGKYNEAISSLAQAQKEALEEETNYQSEIFSALTDWIEEYKENIEQVREAMEDYYEGLMDPLQDEIDARERNIELMELQQNLANAQNEKQRVNFICPL